MTRTGLRTWLVTVLLCAVVIPAQAQVRYRLTRIVADPPTAVSLFAGDLNDRGQVVGSVESGGAPRAFAWRDGITTNLAPLIDPNSPFTDASGNNNGSDIAGSFLDAQVGTFVGFLLRRGEEMTRIEGLPGATATFVQDINNRRQVVGISFDAEGDLNAFVWERGDVMPLLPLPGDTSAAALEINDRGVAVGTSGFLRAVIWEDGTVLDLGLPASNGLDINNRGQVVGWVQDPEGLRPFVWERGEVVRLPPLGGADALTSEALSINNVGEIVGRTFFSEALIATFWDEGVAINLNDLIRANDPLRPLVTLESGVLINDRGEIVASGRDSRSPNQIRLYFLTPVR